MYSYATAGEKSCLCIHTKNNAYNIHIFYTGMWYQIVSVINIDWEIKCR